ncbi:MAG: sigma-70 family RNA polymerase sigma factor, partial [Pseudolysinimonas sp.]
DSGESRHYLGGGADVNPDVELIAKSIARDARAFGDLFDRHATAVYRFAYSLTHDETEAQELVQETFVTAWKKLADIRLVGDSMLPWLIVATRHHSQNLRRAKQRAATFPLDDHILNHGAEGIRADRAEHREELDWVFAAVRELSESDQRIIELCLYEGRTYKEAALQLGLSVTGVTKRVERARAKLRKMRDDDEAGVMS